MLRFALAFLIGDIWVQRLPTLTLSNFIAPIGICLAAILLLPSKRWFGRWLKLPTIVAFLLGLVWTAIVACVQLRQDLDPQLEGRDVALTGYVASIPEVESYGVRFVFLIDQQTIDRQAPALPRHVELTWYTTEAGRGQSIHAAQRWQLQVRLKRRHGFANPGGYDYEAQLFREGIGATGYVRDSASNQLLGVVAGKHVLKLRATLTEAIAQALPKAAMQGVIRGLAVGDQQAIGSEAWQVFARTGTSHLMAISGFHIGMVAWVFAWLGARLVYWPAAQRWRWTVPDLRAWFGMSAALAYSLLAGMSVPTQRTLIMLAVYFGAGLLRREVNVWHGFGVALLLVLIVDPFAPLAMGAWLSFGAVAVILLNQYGRIAPGAGWRGFLNIQAVVTLGLVPLLLSAFGSLSLVSPVVNLVAIPLFTAVLVPWTLIGCALLMLHQGFGTIWLGWLAQVLDWVFAALQWSASFSWANWYAPQAAPWAMALLLLGTVMMILPWLWPLHLSGVLCCLPALCWQVPAPPLGGFTMTTLDVGQGLAVVVRTHEHVLLYDTGPSFQSGRDTGELVVLPYLHAMGVRRLDMLMASHGDADHVGGLQTVLNSMKVQQLLPGPSVRLSTPPAMICQRGQNWQWDGVHFEVLHPGVEHATESDNNQSCVVRIAGAGGSALLLGDVEKPVERELVAAGLIQPVTVVEAAHHGSRSSSTEPLVKAAQAQWVVFSAGYRNRWGFPKEEVVERWQAAGSHSLSTIESGAVTAAFIPGQVVQISRYRQLRRRYWQTQ
ncbi:MAG: DNA internalization-related competence protein ComEC/Rec2 [Steroidobacteraceae bacterium]